MAFPNRVVAAFVVHCIDSLSVYLRSDSGAAVRKDLDQDVPLLLELLYGLNFAGQFCTVSCWFGVLMP